MPTALLYGLGTAIPLLIGVAVGLRWTLPKAVLAAMMAFGAGTTIAVLADSLIPEAYREGGWWVGMATAAGFFVAFAIG